MTDQYEHAFIPTNGIRLHVVTAGPEGGRPVILLHGFPEFWYGWRRQIPALAGSGFRVVVPDQRGYNLSDKPKGIDSYRIDVLAADVLGLIDALGYEKVNLVGHDWGAAVAWQIATVHPERLNRLAILNVPHMAVMTRTLRRSLAQLRRSWYIFYFNIPWLPEYALGRDRAAALVRLMKSSSRRGSFSDEDLVHYREAWTQRGALTAMLNWYRSAVREGFGNLFRNVPLPRVTVPTLMLWGAHDGALGREMAQPSIDLCDDGRLVFFERATHWVQHDEWQEVNSNLLSFLRSEA
jgi:pimeloyl-ACP methyl ester carboxylesterase